MAIKSIPKADVEKLIEYGEKCLKRGNEISNEIGWATASKAYGYTEAALENIIKKLKGEYPI